MVLDKIWQSEEWVTLSNIKCGTKTVDLKVSKMFPGIFYIFNNMLFPRFEYLFKFRDRRIREFVYPMIHR